MPNFLRLQSCGASRTSMVIPSLGGFEISQEEIPREPERSNEQSTFGCVVREHSTRDMVKASARQWEARSGLARHRRAAHPRARGALPALYAATAPCGFAIAPRPQMLQGI